MKERVLLILHLPPPIHGAGIVGESIRTNARINSQFDCRYVNLSFSRNLDDIGRYGIRKLLKLVTIYYRVLKNLIIWRPKLIYLTPDVAGTGFFKDAIIVSLVKLFDAKVIYHLHNKGIRTRSKGLFTSVWIRLFFRNVRVILLAKELYKDVSDYVNEEDIRICHNGIPSITETSLKTMATIPRFLFLSNLLVDKGIVQILDACKYLMEMRYGFELNIVGGEAEWTEKRLKKEISIRGLERHVKYHGRLIGHAKTKIYANSDVFVFPTYYAKECFPLVLIEAMQFGLPIISTFEGGIPSMIEDGVNGVLVEKKRTDLLAKAMMNLSSDRNLIEQFSKKSKSIYTNKFTGDHFERNIITIFDEYLQEDTP